MNTTLELAGISLDVVRKDIKNVHLTVHPPTGRVRISAPSHMRLDSIRVFAISKLPWIRKQQNKLRDQERESPREFIDRESHYVWGRRVLLNVLHKDAVAGVELQHRRLLLHIRPQSDEATRAEVVAAWYRQLLRDAIRPIIDMWERKLGVKVAKFYIQQMKTRWGSANPVAGTIRLNTELAKKPPECLEYIVAHEMIHLIEATHGPRFIALMDRFMPSWRATRDLLNRLPARHEHWEY